MSTQERVYTNPTYHDLSREERFGRGPWLDEPDKVQWTDEATGLPCLAVRHPTMGNWCGYAGVTAEHPLFKVQYDQAPDFEVHGGITYSDLCQEGRPENEGVCHVPAPGEPDEVWWFGFDCGHFLDIVPRMALTAPELYPSDGLPERYRDLDYVKAETASLAAQLAAYQVLKGGSGGE